jgi:hypothetical protein
MKSEGLCTKLTVPSELLDKTDVFIFDCDGVIVSIASQPQSETVPIITNRPPCHTFLEASLTAPRVQSLP